MENPFGLHPPVQVRFFEEKIANATHLCVAFFFEKIHMTQKHCVAAFVACLPIFLLAQPTAPQSAGSNYFDIAKNLEIFANAYREINHSYVDVLDPNKLMRQGLDAMLEGLDPFTNYISETDIEGYRYQTDGKYNGVGAQAKQRGEWVIISDIYEGSPAQKCGLKVGDEIVTIDGQSAKGRTDAAVLEFLRGFPGTEANIRIRRDGKEQTLTLKRADTTIPNVPHYGFVADGIGYINLTVFSQEASRNISNALSELKRQNPDIKGLIIDLRDNGGGLLIEAVNIVNLFVPRGELVVATKGKVPERNNEFKTSTPPLDTNIPVVVLINKMSASASEIVSGSIQDLDRGVLMGQRSYGKGLVQNTTDVGFNARIKLTTSKYYIPSGRCIQSTRYKNGEPVDIPESERAAFRTRNGRVVYDGGGIKPDVLLPHDTANGVTRALLDQFVIFDYATQYAASHPSIDSIEIFEFKDWVGFTQFAQSRNFQYESASEKKLKELRSLTTSENWPVTAELAAIEAKIKAEKAGEMERNKVRILREIEQEIVGRYYFQRGKVRKGLVNDQEVKAAVDLLNNPTEYRRLLQSK
jgi:carboxyl-terminal processing protease